VVDAVEMVRVQKRQHVLCRAQGRKAPIQGNGRDAQIMRAPDGMEVDHINGDGLCNLRENLRVCTKAENMRNRGKQINNTSGYKGVYFNKHAKKFSAQIKLYGKAIYLGLYDSPVEAARAYDAKARELFGEFAVTNFGNDMDRLRQLYEQQRSEILEGDE
jgi:HNH endonuclease